MALLASESHSTRYKLIAAVVAIALVCLWIFDHTLLSSWCTKGSFAPVSLCGLHSVRWERRPGSPVVFGSINVSAEDLQGSHPLWNRSTPLQSDNEPLAYRSSHPPAQETRDSMAAQATRHAPTSRNIPKEQNIHSLHPFRNKSVLGTARVRGINSPGTTYRPDSKSEHIPLTQPLGGLSPNVHTSAAQRLPPVTERVGDQTVMWEKPWGGENAAGVFLLLNGCNHGAEGWWDPQPACPHCLGLPEEKAILEEGLRSNYVVMALSVVQQAATMRCWASTRLPQANRDVLSTVATVNTITSREGWAALPLFAWGGSAGGTFAARLPYFLHLKGIMIQLKGTRGEEMLQPGLWPPPDVVLRGRVSSWSYPAVVYTYNRRDPVATERALDFTAALSHMGVHHALVGADPQPLDAQLFSRRIPRFPRNVSEQVVTVLRDGGFLDDEGYLKSDPRRTDKKWAPLVRRRVEALKHAELHKFVSPIFEELNWAFSNHQGISDTTAASFHFFEDRIKPASDMLWNPRWWQLQGQQPTDGFA